VVYLKKERMMKKLRFLFLVILIFALTSCSQEVIETSKAPDKVTILMNWTIDGQHAPFFVAKEKGFLKSKILRLKKYYVVMVLRIR